MKNNPANPTPLHILIPTFRRPLKLERLLASLSHHGYGIGSGVKITVSENGGSEGANEVVARWEDRLPIRYIHQPAPLGFLLHLASCYASSEGTYCWVIGDDDVLIDAPWTALRDKLAPADLDAVLIGHDFMDAQGGLHHDSGHAHLETIRSKYRGDCLDLVCSSPSTFTFISAVIMRTSRVQQHLARANAGGGFFPLELLLRVAEGGRGEYWAGDRVRGDLDISWGPSAQRYFLHDLPEMFARLALELPREQIEEAIVAIFRDRCVRWEDLVINDRHFADWFYRRHGPAIERARRLLGGNPAVEELYRHRSVRDQLGELSGLIRFKLGHWASKAVRRRP